MSFVVQLSLQSEFEWQCSKWCVDIIYGIEQRGYVTNYANCQSPNWYMLIILRSLIIGILLCCHLLINSDITCSSRALHFLLHTLLFSYFLHSERFPPWWMVFPLSAEGRWNAVCRKITFSCEQRCRCADYRMKARSKWTRKAARGSICHLSADRRARRAARASRRSPPSAPARSPARFFILNMLPI